MAGASGIATGAAGRYATALFELADEAGSLDAIRGEVSAVKTALVDAPDLITVFNDPSVSRDAMSRAVASLAGRMGLSKTMTSFLGLMAANRRLGMLPETLDMVDALIAEKRGETTAEVVSAAPLSDAQASALSSALASAAGKTVHMKTSVDPELIGGLIVKLGSKMIDASLRSKLSRLQQAMKEVG